MFDMLYLPVARTFHNKQLETSQCKSKLEINNTMIEEIFIVDDSNKVLYGDPVKFPKAPGYPIHETNGVQLIQMKINDVRIGILYSFLDRFSVLSHMQRLVSRLEKKLRIINAQTVLENYFLLFELLNRKEGVVMEKNERGIIPSISSNNAYLDIFEYSNVVMDNGGTILNRTNGICYLNTTFDDDRIIRFVASRPTASNKVVYRSSGVISEKLNGMEVKVRSKDAKAEVLRYWIQDGVEPLVEISKVDGGYVLSCKSQIKFDHLEIRFPIPRMASKVVKSHTAGESVYDEKHGILRWKFVNELVRRERINYRVEVFEECEDTRPINVEFYVKEASNVGIRIEKAECIDNPGVHFWIRYSVCNGRYEIRM